ncbi:SDR family oxidoreductase [Amycolatopsis acidiphila]|nr:SDR family oxidoreductase [Amycolatopsis acidiphila]UIJ61956.1 SDR family oxidoreductase [Amycolatopsis acidiphila]
MDGRDPGDLAAGLRRTAQPRGLARPRGRGHRRDVQRGRARRDPRGQRRKLLAELASARGSGRAEEIAAAVAYLASPVADYVSGATLRVDGGTIRSVH